MLKIVLLFGLLAAQDPEVTVTLTDGTRFRGQLEGYENGRYRLRVQGSLQEIDDRQVMSVDGGTAPTSAPAPRSDTPFPKKSLARITLTDGRTIRGELLGYEDGRYMIIVDAKLETVEEGLVLELDLSLPGDAGAAPETAAAMRTMGYEDAIQKIAETLHVVEQDRRLAIQGASTEFKTMQEYQRLALQDASERFSATQEEYRRSLQDTAETLKGIEQQQRQTFQEAADRFAALQEEHRRSLQDTADLLLAIEQRQNKALEETSTRFTGIQEEYRKSAQDISNNIKSVDLKQSRSIGEVNTVLRDMRQERTRELHEMVGRLYEAYIAKLISESGEDGDGGALTEMFRTMATSFSADTQREIVRRMGQIFIEKSYTAPNDASATAFVQAASRLPAMDAAAQALRTLLTETFIQMGRRQVERGDYAGAMTLYQAVLAADPSQTDALRPEVLEIALARARDRVAKNDNPGALAAAGLILQLDPNNEEGRVILQESMARNVVPGDALPSDTHPQLRRYFPVRAGQYIRYRRPSADLMVEVSTEEIEQEDRITKVTYAYKDIYRNWTTSKRYQLEVERDAVIMATGVDREPVLRFPVRLGQEWSWKTRSQQFTRKITGVGVAVEVGAAGRRFRFPDCIVVEFTSSSEAGGKVASLTSRSTYASEVGLIKLEFLSADQKKFNLELIEYGLR